MSTSALLSTPVLPGRGAALPPRSRRAARRVVFAPTVASSARAGSRDVAVGASRGDLSSGSPDHARVAAAVRLAAAVSPALAAHRAARGRAAIAPRSHRASGRGAPAPGSGSNDERSIAPTPRGPSHGRYAETLGAVSFPGGWWGPGTYTDAHLRAGTRANAASSRGAPAPGSRATTPGERSRSASSSSSSSSSLGSPAPSSGAPDVRARVASSVAPTSPDDDDSSSSSSDDPGPSTPNPLEQVWLRLVKPLRDFGFGRTNIWEGGVGLFLVGGVGVAALCVNWVLGVNFNKMRSYQAFVEFPFACGIQVGTTVRVRGVKVGNVLSVRPNLERVEVLVEMDDDGIVIPRNSLVEANQSGLIAETIIDITPEIPIPNAKWGPLDSGCEGEGLVVCDRGKIVGVPGVSMDELVGICTKLAREMDQQNGIAKMFATAESAQDLMKNLEPLLLEAAEIAKELRPMLQNVQEQGTLDTIELLAGHATKAVTDIRELKRTILTDENQEMLRQSITIMTKTLQHMEKVSGDISSVSGDPATRQNLRHLIQCLSRLVDK